MGWSWREGTVGMTMGHKFHRKMISMDKQFSIAGVRKAKKKG